MTNIVHLLRLVGDSSSVDSEEDSEEGSEECEVEAILDKRVNDIYVVVEYLVTWRDYDDSWDSLGVRGGFARL